MQEKYFVKSRYGATHTFKRNGLSGNFYSFVPAEEWMPIYLTFDEKDNKKIVGVDTDGGPFMSKGWSNGEITILGITENGEFELAETKKPHE